MMMEHLLYSDSDTCNTLIFTYNRLTFKLDPTSRSISRSPAHLAQYFPESMPISNFRSTL